MRAGLLGCEESQFTSQARLNSSAFTTNGTKEEDHILTKSESLKVHTSDTMSKTIFGM